MKLMFCFDDQRVLDRLVDRPLAGQNVVMPCHPGDDLISLVASTEPHLVVIFRDGPDASDALQSRLREAGFYLPILTIDARSVDDRQLDEVWRRLQSCSRNYSGFEFDSEDYEILTETSPEEDTQAASAVSSDSAAQENRFLALLTVAKTHHCKARAYLKAARATERHCKSDWVLSVLAENSTAYLWRTQLFRYVSALAHYVPGVDVECLPLAYPPSSKLDYLPTALAPHAYYALCAVRAFGINPQCSQALWEVGQLQAGVEKRVSSDCAQFAGWARLVRKTASANIDFLDACLANNPARLAAMEEARHGQNQRRIFCHWWNLTEFVDAPERLSGLVGEFHAGRRSEGIPAFDSFFRFTERIQEQFREDWGRN